MEAEAGYPIIAGFLQGCCGDIRPALVSEGEFYRGDAADVRRLGDTLATEVWNVLHQPMRVLSGTPLAGRKLDIDLKLQPMKMNDEQVQWRQLLADEPWRLAPTRTLEIIRIDLAEGFSLIGMNGEMAVQYGSWIRQASNQVCWPVAYCNGMIGYIPTAAQLAEGGYEATEFIYAFGMPAPYSPECEEVICQATLALASDRK